MKPDAVKITSPDKVLWPRDGYTKADMIAYYEAVAPMMLPFMRGHPLAMLRFNQGIDGERFFHKQAPDYFPDFIGRVDVPKSKGTTRYPICDNTAALKYIANHNCIEFHLLGVPADDLSHPDRMVFDLDPSTENFNEVRQAAVLLRKLLNEIGVDSYLMTSGSRGLHIWVPLTGRDGVEEVIEFAGAVAAVLVGREPDLLTTAFSKEDRGDRIYIDIARNAPAQHAVAPYSLRARDGAPAATPVDWSELDDREFGPQRYALATMAERLDQTADPWKGMRRRAKALAKPRARLARLAAT